MVDMLCFLNEKMEKEVLWLLAREIKMTNDKGHLDKNQAMKMRLHYEKTEELSYNRQENNQPVEMNVIPQTYEEPRTATTVLPK